MMRRSTRGRKTSTKLCIQYVAIAARNHAVPQRPTIARVLALPTCFRPGCRYFIEFRARRNQRLGPRCGIRCFARRFRRIALWVGHSLHFTPSRAQPDTCTKSGDGYCEHSRGSTPDMRQRCDESAEHEGWTRARARR
jgi:hypothetical protein